MGAKSLFPNLDDYFGRSYTANKHIPILPLNSRELLDAAEKCTKRTEKYKPKSLYDDALFIKYPHVPPQNFHITGRFADYPSDKDVETITHPPYEVHVRRQVKYRPRTFYDAWDCENEVDFFYAPDYRSVQASFPEPIKFYSNEFKPFFDACRPDPKFFFPPGSDVDMQIDRLTNSYFKSKDRYKPYVKDIAIYFNLVGKIKKMSQPPDYLLFYMHHIGLHIPGFIDCYQTESGKYLLYNGYFNFAFPIIGEGKFPKWTVKERLVYLYLSIRTFHELEWKINSRSGEKQFSLPQFEINEKRSKEMDGFGRAVLSRLGFHRYYNFSVYNGALRLNLYNDNELAFIKRFKECIFVQDNELFDADRCEIYVNLDFVEYTSDPRKKVLSVRNPPNLHPPPAEIPLDYTKIPLMFGSCLHPDAANHHSHTREEDIETAETAAAAIRYALNPIVNEGLISEDPNVSVAPVHHNSFYRSPTKFIYKGIAMQENMLVDRGPYKGIGRKIGLQQAGRMGYSIADPKTHRIATPPPHLRAEQPLRYRVITPPTGVITTYQTSPPIRQPFLVSPVRQTPVAAPRRQPLPVTRTFLLPQISKTEPIHLPTTPSTSSSASSQRKYPTKRVEYGSIAKPYKYVTSDPSAQTLMTFSHLDKRIERPRPPDARFQVYKPADQTPRTALRTHKNSAAMLVAHGSVPGRITRIAPANVVPSSVPYRYLTPGPPAAASSPLGEPLTTPTKSLSPLQAVPLKNMQAPKAAPAEIDILEEGTSGDVHDDGDVSILEEHVQIEIVVGTMVTGKKGRESDPMGEIGDLVGLFDQAENGAQQENTINEELEPEVDTPKKRRGRPRNEDRLPEITAVEPLTEQEKEERRKNNKTRTRFCNKEPEFTGLPNPTKVRDPENPKPQKIPLRVYIGFLRNNGATPRRKRGRPRKTCYARGRIGAHISKLVVALRQKRGNPIPTQPTLPDDEVEKLAAEAQSRNIVVTYGQPKETKKRTRPSTLSPFFYAQPKKRRPKTDVGTAKEHKKKKKGSILMTGKQPRIRAPRYDSWDGLWPVSRLNALKEWLAEPIDFVALDDWHLPPPTINDPYDPNELWNAAPITWAKYAKDVLPAPDDYIWKDYDPLAEKYRKEAEAEGLPVEKDGQPEAIVPEESADITDDVPEPVPSIHLEAEKEGTEPQWELPSFMDYADSFAGDENLLAGKGLDFSRPIEVHRADVVFDPVENIVAPIEKAAEEENAKNEEQPTILTKELVSRLRHPKQLPWPLAKWRHRFHHGRMLTRTEVHKRKEVVSGTKMDTAQMLRDVKRIVKKVCDKIVKKENRRQKREVGEIVEALIRAVENDAVITSESIGKDSEIVPALEKDGILLEPTVQEETVLAEPQAADDYSVAINEVAPIVSVLEKDAVYLEQSTIQEEAVTEAVDEYSTIINEVPPTISVLEKDVMHLEQPSVQEKAALAEPEPAVDYSIAIDEVSPIVSVLEKDAIHLEKPTVQEETVLEEPQPSDDISISEVSPTITVLEKDAIHLEHPTIQEEAVPEAVDEYSTIINEVPPTISVLEKDAMHLEQPSVQEEAAVEEPQAVDDYSIAIDEASPTLTVLEKEQNTVQEEAVLDVAQSADGYSISVDEVSPKDAIPAVDETVILAGLEAVEPSLFEDVLPAKAETFLVPERVEDVSPVAHSELSSYDVVAPERVESSLSVVVAASTSEPIVDTLPPMEEDFSVTISDLLPKEAILANESEAPGTLESAVVPILDITASSFTPETVIDSGQPTIENVYVAKDQEITPREIVETAAVESDTPAIPEELEPSLAVPLVASKPDSFTDTLQPAEELPFTAIDALPSKEADEADELETSATPKGILIDFADPNLEPESVDDTFEIIEEATFSVQTTKDTIISAEELEIPIASEAAVSALAVPFLEPESVVVTLPNEEVFSSASRGQSLDGIVVADESELPTTSEAALVSLDVPARASTPDFNVVADVLQSLTEMVSSIEVSLPSDVIAVAAEPFAFPEILAPSTSAQPTSSTSEPFIDTLQLDEEADFIAIEEMVEKNDTETIKEAVVCLNPVTTPIEELASELLLQDESPAVPPAPEPVPAGYNADNILAAAAERLEIIPTTSHELNKAVEIVISSAPKEVELEEELTAITEDREDRRTLKLLEDETESVTSTTFNNNAVADNLSEETLCAEQPLLETRKRRLFSDDTEHSDDATEISPRKRIFSATDSSTPSSVRHLEALLDAEAEQVAETLEQTPEAIPGEQLETSATTSTPVVDLTTSEEVIDYDVKPRGPMRKYHDDLFVTPAYKQPVPERIPVTERLLSGALNTAPSTSMSSNVMSQTVRADLFYTDDQVHLARPVERGMFRTEIPPNLVAAQPRPGYPQPYLGQQGMMGGPAQSPFYSMQQGYPMAPGMQMPGMSYQMPPQGNEAYARHPQQVNTSHQAWMFHQQQQTYRPYQQYQQYPLPPAPGMQYYPQSQRQQQHLQYNRSQQFMAPGPSMPMVAPGATMVMAALGTPRAMATPGTPMPMAPSGTPMVMAGPSTPMPMAPPATPMPMMAPATPMAMGLPPTPLPATAPGTPLPMTSTTPFVPMAPPVTPQVEQVRNIYADVGRKPSRPTTAAGTPTEAPLSVPLLVEPFSETVQSPPPLPQETMRMIDESIAEIRSQKNKILKDDEFHIAVDMSKVITAPESVETVRVENVKRMTSGKPSHFKSLPSTLRGYLDYEISVEQRNVMDKLRNLIAQSAMSLAKEPTNWESWGDRFSPHLMVHSVCNIYQALQYSGYHRIECTAMLVETLKLRRALEMIYEELGNEYKQEGDILKTMPSNQPSAAVRPFLLPSLCEQIGGEYVAKQTIKMPAIHQLNRSNELYAVTSDHLTRNTKTLRDSIRLFLNNVPNKDNIPEGEDRCILINCAVICTENLTTTRGRRKKDQERSVGCHQFIVLSEKLQSTEGDTTVIKVGPFSPLRLENITDVEVLKLWNTDGSNCGAELDMSKRDFGFIYCDKLYPAGEDGQYANFICNLPFWEARFAQPKQVPQIAAEQEPQHLVPESAIELAAVYQQEPETVLVEEPEIETLQEHQPGIETAVQEECVTVFGQESEPVLEQRPEVAVEEEPAPMLGQVLAASEPQSVLEEETERVEELPPTVSVISQIIQQEAEYTSRQESEPVLEEGLQIVSQEGADLIPVEEADIAIQLQSAPVLEQDEELVLEEQPIQEIQQGALTAVEPESAPTFEKERESAVEEEQVQTLEKDAERTAKPSPEHETMQEQPQELKSLFVCELLLGQAPELEPVHVAEEEMQEESVAALEQAPQPVTPRVDVEEIQQESEVVVEKPQELAQQESEPEPMPEVVIEEVVEQAEVLSPEHEEERKGWIVAIRETDKQGLIAPGTMAPVKKPLGVSFEDLMAGTSEMASLLSLLPQPTLSPKDIAWSNLQIRAPLSVGFLSPEELRTQHLQGKQILETVHQFRVLVGKCINHYMQVENHIRPTISTLNSPMGVIFTAQSFFTSTWRYHTLYGLADCVKKLCTPSRIENWISQNVAENVIDSLGKIYKFTQQNFTISEVDQYNGCAQQRLESMKGQSPEMIANVSMEAAFAIISKLYISPDILNRFKKLLADKTPVEMHKLRPQFTPNWNCSHRENIKDVNNLGISISVNLNDYEMEFCKLTLEEQAKVLADKIADTDTSLAPFLRDKILENVKTMNPLIRNTCVDVPLEGVTQCVRDASLYLLIQDQMNFFQERAANTILRTISRMNIFYDSIKNQQNISSVPREQLIFDFDPASYGPKIFIYEPPEKHIELKIGKKNNGHENDGDSREKDGRKGGKRPAPDTSSSGTEGPLSKMQNISMGHGFWQACDYQPSLPSIRSGQGWDTESIVSGDSGVGSSCPSITSRTSVKRKYPGSEEKGMKTSKSSSVLESSVSTSVLPNIRTSVEPLVRLTAAESTPVLLKYLTAPLGASPQSATSSGSRDSSQPPRKRSTPSTSKRPTPLATPNSTALDPLSVIIPTERRHSQMFDTLLDVATREFRDSRSGSEDVEVLDLSVKRNPPQSPLVSNHPTPLATPTSVSVDHQTTLLIPHTKEIEKKRQQLLQLQQEAYEQQTLQRKKEKQHLEQLRQLQREQQPQEEPPQEKQPAVPKTVEARTEKRPVKVLTVLDLPPIDEEELEADPALPKKPNTFEFHFFNRNRYTVEKNWRERKVIIGKSTRAGRGKRAHCPPTAEAKQVHKMFLTGKTELKLILKGAKLDFYEMEKQYDLDHSSLQSTPPGPSTDMLVLPKSFRPISPPTTSQDSNTLLIKRVDAILASPEITQQCAATTSSIQLVERPRIVTKAALKELPPPRVVQALPCAAPTLFEEIVVEEEPEFTEKEQRVHELLHVETEFIEEEPETAEQEYEAFEEQSFMVDEETAVLEEEGTVRVHEEDEVMEEEYEDTYEPEVIVLTDSEDDAPSSSSSSFMADAPTPSPDFIDVVGTSPQPASPKTVPKVKLIFDEDLEDSDEESAVDVVNDADEGVEVDIEMDDDEEEELGRLVIDETSPLPSAEREISHVQLNSALNKLKIQLFAEKEKSPGAERIPEPSPLITVATSPVPESAPEPRRYTGFLVEDLLRDKYTKRVETRRKEICHFQRLPRIPLQPPFVDLFLDRLRRTAFTAEYERKRLMEMNSCERAFKHLHEHSEPRHSMENYPLRRVRSADSFFGRNVDEHFGEHWEFAEQRMFLEDLNLYPLVTQNILGTVLSRCNSPASIAPCHQDDTVEERAFAYRTEMSYSGDDFYDSSEDFDRENKVIFPEEDLGHRRRPLDGDESFTSSGNAETASSSWDDQIEILSPEESSEVSSVADNLETQSQYDYVESLSSHSDLETRSL